MKTKGEIEDLKSVKKKEEEKEKKKQTSKKGLIIKMVKIYLGLSLLLLWAVCGQFIFG